MPQNDMRITEAQLVAFKGLYAEQFGVVLEEAEVLAKALRLLRLMEIVYQPLPSHIRLPKRRIKSLVRKT